ncbi:hypothetical protein [Sphingobacterium sp. LRF_L2]|uniref:hypothetical protein n=1 Tax=Sphingobacterium sp. LRF_L2 TaxID=3369421 RepID=UPI003F6142C5
MKNLFVLILFVSTTLSLCAQDFKPYYSHNFNFGMSYTAGTSRENFDAFDDDNIDFLGLQFNYIGLIHLNPHIAVGAGTGVRHLVQVDNWDLDDDDWDAFRSYVSVPLYGHFRFRILDKRVSPFVATSLGYNFRISEDKHTEYINGSEYKRTSTLSSGILANIEAGVNVKIARSFAISAGPYFEYKQGRLKDVKGQSFDGSLNGDNYSVRSMTSRLHLYEAGLKVGFAF